MPIASDPLCVRFQAQDVVRIRVAAARDGMLRSAWVREVAVAQARVVLDGEDVGPLAYETAHGPGDQLCIRLRASDAEIISRAAKKASAHPSTWIRAVVMRHVQIEEDRMKRFRTKGGRT